MAGSKDTSQSEAMLGNTWLLTQILTWKIISNASFWLIDGPATGLAHYSDVLMGTMASQITGVLIICPTVCSGADKKASKLRVTGRCEGINRWQRASIAENVSIWWHHHAWTLFIMGWICHFLHFLPDTDFVPAQGYPVHRTIFSFPIHDRHKIILHLLYSADSGLEPSHWETSLQSNAVCHWLHANLESSLYYIPGIRRIGGCDGFMSKLLTASCINGVNAITRKALDKLL